MNDFLALVFRGVNRISNVPSFNQNVRASDWHCVYLAVQHAWDVVLVVLNKRAVTQWCTKGAEGLVGVMTPIGNPKFFLAQL